MKPDGTLEDWDEILLPNYLELSAQIDPVTRIPYRQRRSRGARVQDLFLFVEMALKQYQSYFVKKSPWRGYFQFARYLDVGHKIYNHTTGDVYTVKELFYEPDDSFTGEVLLTGGTDPEETDRLRLDDRNLIVFSHADPRSEVPSVNVEGQGERADEPALLNDTIELSIMRSEPGTVGKKPFDRERQALPLLREPHTDDLIDPGMVADIYGWWFDHIIQFDLFSRTNDRLYGRRKPDSSGTQGLVEWFQDFMQRNRWVYLYNGIQQILEWQGTQDKPLGRFRNDMVHRPLLFYVRTERVSTARYRRIEQIDVLVNIGLPEELVIPSACPVPTGQIDVTVNDLGLYAELGDL
jgi:hypothetical protein